MFAEELGANSGRKRAEANRAKRLQMKQQQQKKLAQQKQLEQKKKESQSIAAAASSENPTGNGVDVSAPLADGKVLSATSTAFESSTNNIPPSLSSNNHAKPLSAVERANQQRELRALEARQTKSVLQIQATYRRYRSNAREEVSFQNLLQKRLGDLKTLSTIIQQKKGIELVPPPATTSSLVRMALWLLLEPPHRTSHQNSWGKRRILPISSEKKTILQQIVQLCLLPGLRSQDDDKNPFVAWVQSSDGKLRIGYILHVLLVCLVETTTSEDFGTLIIVFLRTITGLSSTNTHDATLNGMTTEHIQFACGFLGHSGKSKDVILPPEKKEANRQNGGMLKHIYERPDADFVALLRYYLHFIVAGPQPIPAQAEALREASIPDNGKKRAGLIFSFALDFAQLNKYTSDGLLRFFTHVLSVPLLAWKLPSETLSSLVMKSKMKPPFVSMLGAFNYRLQRRKPNESVLSILPGGDVPLSACPATSTQCLLANLAQLGRLSPQINGSSLQTINFDWTCLFVDVLSVLLHEVPTRTFCARESAVEWMSDNKGHLTPVVLSPLVLEHCKSLFVDSYVRGLFLCSIDANRLNIDGIINGKNEKDKQMEKEVADEIGSTAAALAAKESRMDHSKSFWNSSKWAKKISKGMSGFLSSTKSKSHDESRSLLDKSSISRSLATGENTDDALEAARGRDDYSPELLISLSRMFSIVLARWGGGGGRDEVSGKLAGKGADKEMATAAPELFTYSVLSVLCHSTQFIKAAWCLIQSNTSITKEVSALIDQNQGTPPVRQLECISPVGSNSSKRFDRGASVLYLFTAAMAHTLLVTDDAEIHDFDRPLPLHQLRRMIKVQKKLLHRCCSLDTGYHVPNFFGLALIAATSRSFRDLYDRSSRRPLCVPKVWLIAGLLEKEIKSCKTHEDYITLLKSTKVLRLCPMLVSFKRRLELFDKIVRSNREELQGVNSPNPFNPNPLKPARVVIINRGRILEDGLNTMNQLGSKMRERLSVHYINEAGVKETGVDAGGLFKEFWTDLCAIAFDPNYALFQVTEDSSGCMFPSPMSGSAHGSSHTVLFEFLGRILGKALYEGITIQPRFAHFFLSFLRGDYNYFHMLADLSTIDQQLYKNLMVSQGTPRIVFSVREKVS